MAGSSELEQRTARGEVFDLKKLNNFEKPVEKTANQREGRIKNSWLSRIFLAKDL